MSVKNIALKKKQEKTSTVNWKEKWLELKKDYDMLWEDYIELICKIGKLSNAARIRELLNNPDL